MSNPYSSDKLVRLSANICFENENKWGRKPELVAKILRICVETGMSNEEINHFIWSNFGHEDPIYSKSLDVIRTGHSDV